MVAVPDIIRFEDHDGDGKAEKREVIFTGLQSEAAKLNGEKDRYAVGQSIPLERFVPGEYTIKVELLDTVLNKSYEMEKQFRVQQP